GAAAVIPGPRRAAGAVDDADPKRHGHPPLHRVGDGRPPTQRPPERCVRPARLPGYARRAGAGTRGVVGAVAGAASGLHEIGIVATDIGAPDVTDTASAASP